MGKVSQWTPGSRQYRTEGNESFAQQTLGFMSRTYHGLLEDSKDRNGIFTLGSIYHDSSILLPDIGRTQEEWM